MARVEKTIFISYRRTDVYIALAVYEILKNQGYDVFFDYRSISSGDFEQIITSNIRARAHFILILTPTALDRCDEPGDWLRREIELAIDDKRNIVPLFFKGFRFGTPSVTEKLTGKLKNLSHYNGLNVHEDYFDEAMQRLRTQYLSFPLNTVLHPVSTEVQKMVKEEQIAADKALEKIENVQELVKKNKEKPSQPKIESSPKLTIVVPTKKSVSTFNFRLIGSILGGILLVSLLIWAISKFSYQPPAATITPTQTSLSVVTATYTPTQSITPTIDVVFLPPRVGQDGMTLLYVPAGNFAMGSDTGSLDESPIHTVYLDAFWIDKTEVTNKMYSSCVDAGKCKGPSNETSTNRPDYYGNILFDNYPVIYVDWNMAKTYCGWVGRRLPSEAEWEKASSWDVKNQHKNLYPWGDSTNYCSLSNSADEFGKNCVGNTTEVGRYPNGASPYGALDMSGNVWEWVEDWYSAYPGNRESNAGYGTTYRVLRGSAWNSISFPSSVYRYRSSPTTMASNIGFRCAMSATP